MTKTDPRLAQVDQLFSRWAKSSSPGCAIAIMQDGEIIYEQGYGMANLEYDIPITPSSIFHVASVSKQFAAAAMALLELDGKLSVDDDVHKYLPDLPDFGETITVRNLINHTSGIRDQWELLTAAGWRMDDVITTQDVLDLVYKQTDLNFKPGSEYMYCNTGYTLLDIIVRNVAGKTLREFCDERMFKPLGMTSTHFHDDHNEIVPNRTYSYEETANGYQHSHLMYATVGATSLFTTVGDLLRWEANFFEPVVGGQVFLDRMVERGVLTDGEEIAYAFGLAVHDYRGVRCVEHSGGDAGYRTHLLHFPAQKFAVVVLSNLASFSPGSMTFGIADIFLADQFTSETFPPAITLPAEQVKAFAGNYYSTRNGSWAIGYDEDKNALTIWGSYALEPTDETTFRIVIAPQTVIHFSADGLVLDNWIGRPSVYEKIAAQTLDAAALGAYVGHYRSPELNVEYEIALENGALALKRRKHGASPLLPTVTDGFMEANGGYDLLFTRDSLGAVNGFALTSGRIRNVRFERLP